MVIQEIKADSYQITDQETGVTGRDVATGERRDEWEDLWRYQIPIGISYALRPTDHFSLYAQYVSDTVDHGILDDNASYTDDTIDLNDAGADDVALLPATEVANEDGFIFGHRYPFSRVRVVVGVAGVGSGSVIAWQYRTTGSAWTTIPAAGFTDGSSNWLNAAATFNIDFIPPADWVRDTISGRYGYFIRALVTTANFTTTPLATSATINGGNRALLTRDRFRIELRDSAEESKMEVLRQHNYTQLTNFVDVNQKALLDLPHAVEAKQGMWIVVQVQPTAGIVDASLGYFALECERLRQGIS